MPQYQWVIQERNGAPIADLANLTKRSITIPLNRPPEAHATLRVTDPNAVPRLLTSGVSELVIYRDGLPLETVFQLTDVAVVGDRDTQEVELTWLGIMSYLQYGLVNAGGSLTAAQSRVAWQWITTFQGRTGASVYGLLDYGAPTAGDPSKTAIIEEDTDLLDAIIALSERDDGFDFSVDPGRYFRCYYPRRGSDKSADVVLEYGVNVDEYALEFDTSPGTIATDTRVSGGPETPIVTSADTTARTTYGRREASVQYSDVTTPAVSALQQFSDALVAERAHPQVIPSVTLTRDHPSLPFGSYDVGDTVLLIVEAGNLVSIQDPFRIVQMGIDLDDNDNETITLDLNDV